jgi:hypothetical protein
MANKVTMPVSAWPTLKKIIRAYGEVQDLDKPTVITRGNYSALSSPAFARLRAGDAKRAAIRSQRVAAQFFRFLRNHPQEQSAKS